MPSLYKTNEEFLDVYYRHVDTVYRVCFSFMKNKQDTEDTVQETFLRLLSSGKEFESERHEKAWLIVTASNVCKDTLKKWWRRSENIEDYLNTPDKTRQEDEILDVILQLPDAYKDAVYMYYYEGYSTAEIAKHTSCPEATVRSRLLRAKKKLRIMLGGAEK